MPGVRFLNCLLKALLPVVGVSAVTVSIAVAVRRVGNHGSMLAWPPLHVLACSGASLPAVLTTFYGAHSVFLPGVVVGSAVAITAACYSQSASTERRLFRFISISEWLKECLPGFASLFSCR